MHRSIVLTKEKTVFVIVRGELEKPLKISLCYDYSTEENVPQHTTATAAFHSQVY